MAGTTFSCPSVCVIVVVNAKIKTHTHTHSHTKSLIMLITYNIKFSDSVFYCCLGVACKIYKIVAVNFFNLN